MGEAVRVGDLGGGGKVGVTVGTEMMEGISVLVGTDNVGLAGKVFATC